MSSVEPASRLAAVPASVVPSQGTPRFEPYKVTVQDADKFREFYGFRMYNVSTEVPHKPQWLEIELWKVVDGTCRYVLHFVGKSVLIHEEGSSCNTGVPTPKSLLHKDAEPCRKCRPILRGAADTTVFEAEIDRHKIEVCDGRPRDEDTGELYPAGSPEMQAWLARDELQRWILSAREMLRSLRDSWHRRPELAGTLSAPAQRLVDTAARMDPAIRAAVTVVEELLPDRVRQLPA